MGSDAIDVGDPETRSRVLLAVACACALATVGTMAQAVSQVWPLVGPASFKQWILQISGSIGLLAGTLCLLGTLAVLFAHRPDHDTRRVRIVAISLALITGTAVVVAVLGVWSTLALYVSTPTNLYETFSIGAASNDYPMSFVVAGVLHGLATLALLVPALHYLLRYLRSTAPTTVAIDDDTDLA